jgi:FkbM family methyltransferase
MKFEPALIFDVGMHIGEDTDFYLRKGFKVVSFEANPSLADVCKARFAKQISGGQLTIVEGAIAPKHLGDRIKFYESSASIWGTIEPKWVERNASMGASAKIVDVPRVDISEAFNRFGIPLYLKIDIEGADVYALDAVRELSRKPKYISIEAEKVDFTKLVAELNNLRELGYQKFKIVQQETIPHTVINSSNLDGTPFQYRFEEQASGPFGDEIAQPWIDYSRAVEKYRSIFREYRLFGDNSPLRRLKCGDVFLRRLQRVIRRPLPGWYDTHGAV